MSSAIAKLTLRMMPLAFVLDFGTLLCLIKEQLYSPHGAVTIQRGQRAARQSHGSLGGGSWHSPGGASGDWLSRWDRRRPPGLTAQRHGPDRSGGRLCALLAAF